MRAGLRCLGLRSLRCSKRLARKAAREGARKAAREGARKAAREGARKEARKEQGKKQGKEQGKKQAKKQGKERQAREGVARGDPGSLFLAALARYTCIHAIIPTPFDIPPSTSRLQGAAIGLLHPQHVGSTSPRTVTLDVKLQTALCRRCGATP
eukprot:362786-Chlamydomonas_euryale.AAC.3